MIVEPGKRKEERLKDLDPVALLTDLPDVGLKAGHVGTVVFVHEGNDDYEVEFVKADRESIITTVPRAALLKLKGLPEARPGSVEKKAGEGP